MFELVLIKGEQYSKKGLSDTRLKMARTILRMKARVLRVVDVMLVRVSV